MNTEVQIEKPSGIENAYQMLIGGEAQGHLTGLTKEGLVNLAAAALRLADDRCGLQRMALLDMLEKVCLTDYEVRIVRKWVERNACPVG